MEIYLINGSKLNLLLFFLYILLFIFVLKILLFIKHEIFINKKENMKNIILFILMILCVYQVCLIKAQQQKIIDLERTLNIKEQVILNNRR